MTLFYTAAVLAGLSVVAHLLTIKAARRFNWGADNKEGVQKFHDHWVPRLGGLPIMLCFAGFLVLGMQDFDDRDAVVWAMCLMPAFVAGLAEDLSQQIGPAVRLFLTMIGAAFAWFMLDVRVTRLGPDAIDHALATLPLLSLALTVLFVGGAAHALNIIDGYNGLASSYVLLTLAAILVVALRLDDMRVAQLAAGALAVTLGFFVLNFPFGRIFLGDGGSYVLGTIVAFLLAKLVLRNPEVSPWFAAVLLVYPVWETLFSMYRRRILRGRPTMQPDAIHLHTLLYKRLVRTNGVAMTPAAKALMNSATTVYFLAGNAAMTSLAVVFWANTRALFAVFVAFIVGYVALYLALVRFRAPRRFSLRETFASSAIEVEAGLVPGGQIAAAAAAGSRPAAGVAPAVSAIATEEAIESVK